MFYGVLLAEEVVGPGDKGSGNTTCPWNRPVSLLQFFNASFVNEAFYSGIK